MNIPDSFCIINATLYDGTGTPPYQADITVAEGRIAAVQPAGESSRTGIYIIDAKGLALAPGFIDAHSHSDSAILANPDADSKISQGVTTDITGNCGGSACIAKKHKWDNVAGYAQAVNEAHPAINIATLVGHNTLRARVIGYENRPATAAEINQMKAIAAQALREGACGLSSGLWYIPGKYSTSEEIIELGSVLRGTNKPYATHMRSESDTLLESIDEAIAVAANGSNRLQISHIKTAGCPRNWAKINAVLDKIAQAQSRGMTVCADRYPYIYSGTSLRMIVEPPWDTISNLHELLKNNPAKGAELAKFLDDTKDPDIAWKRTILTASIAEHQRFFGQSLWDIAQQLQLTPGQTTVKLLAEAPSTSAAFGKMSPENLDIFLRQDYIAAGSDSSTKTFAYSDTDRGHPRDFGTFPLFFQKVKRLASAAEAIRRMTSLPATIFNIPERGIVKPGFIADLVLFNEDEFEAQSTFADPHARCTGIRFVFVNGKLAFDGEHPDYRGRHGRFLAL